MSRSQAISYLCAITLCLGPPSSAWCDAEYAAGAAAGTRTGSPVPTRVAPEVRRHAQDEDQDDSRKSGQDQDGAPAGSDSPSPAAAAALSRGRREKGEGHLALAEEQFQKALASASRGSKVYKAALEELTYQLPLMRVQRYVLAGARQKAGRLLEELLQEHQSDEKKSRHLVELIARLRKGGEAQDGVYSQPGSGHRTISVVERTLNRFYRKHGRYPRDYDELNQILPPDRYPLTDYDIVHYVEQGHAYGLTLRSKSDPDNILTVQDTGLVQ
ncbi:MAG: hypothetical protein WB783_11080 [Arenicellales bacterium]